MNDEFQWMNDELYIINDGEFINYYTLLNVSRSEGNETMKFGQLIECKGSFKKYVTQKNSNFTPPPPPIVTDRHIFSDTPYIST